MALKSSEIRGLPFSRCLNLIYRYLRLPYRGIGPSQEQLTHKENRKPTSIPPVGSKPTTAVLQWQKTITLLTTPNIIIGIIILIIIIIIIIISLKYDDIKGETESTIVAAQDQAISTNSFKNKTLKKEIESKCRLCKQHEETIDHLTSGCPILAKNE
jgi:cell division protein FtsL